MNSGPRYPSLPWRVPLAVLISLGAFVGSVKLWIDSADLVPAHDLLAYALVTVPEIPFWQPKYTLLYSGGRPASLDTAGALTPRTVDLKRLRVSRDTLRDWLQNYVYEGKTLPRVLWWPIAVGLATLFTLLAIAGTLDGSARAEVWDGRVLRGPRIVSRWRWNLRAFWKRKDAWHIETRAGKIFIPADRISHHLQFVGATGTMKSSLIRQLVDQAIEREIPCVFLDPKREYLEEYYRDGIDYLLDFGDQRCVRWMIGQEAVDEPHAMPLGEGAIPDEPGRSFFFQDHARAIISYLIGTYHPTTTELAHWMANPDPEIDMRLLGTEHASTMSKNSADQRNGIIGTMNHLGRALRWMPDENGRREFTVAAWGRQGKRRKGHIFLSSTPTTFAALRPMHSLILDLVFLALQTYGAPAMVVADEIARYQRVPQLEPALSLQRSSGCPIILAYQGFAQLESHYGEKLAEAIGSNPYTNIVLRTASERSAKHCSALLGLPAQKERVRESRSGGVFARDKRNYQAERVMEPAVTPGEIQAQEDGCGWISSAGMITKIKIAYRPSRPRVPRLIERTINMQPNLVAANAIANPPTQPIYRNPGTAWKTRPAQGKLPLAGTSSTA